MSEGWERYRWLLLLVAVPLLIGLGMLLDRQIDSPRPLELRSDSPTSAQDGELKVYVTGAVKQTGVYSLQPGDRIIDAIAAAGGPTADADLEQVNLAQRVRDGDRVIVFRRAQEVAGASVTSASAGSASRININTAPADRLDSLPGIGEARSQNIVASRQRNGLFLRTEELVERKLIPQSVYEQIRDLITVGP